MSDLAQKIHFVGIGGAGMAPLAEIMLSRGAAVSGSDRELNAKTALLAARGAAVREGHSAGFLPPDAGLLVYSSAVTPENPERMRAAELGIPQIRRGEFLARLAAQYRRPVAVSGSHGKTSISAMLTHILVHAGRRPGFLIGAAVKGAPSASAGEGDDLFVTEVDESDGTHTLVHPYLGVVPNVEDDHSWSVGGEAQLFANFRRFASQCKHLVYYAGLHTDELFASHPDALRLEYPLPGSFGRRWIGYQAWNAHLAIRAAVLLGVDAAEAEKALESFGGVARRMATRFQSERVTVIEDYAHHPTELASSIGTLRAGYPGHHLRVVFQPHRYGAAAEISAAARGGAGEGRFGHRGSGVRRLVRIGSGRRCRAGCRRRSGSALSRCGVESDCGSGARLPGDAAAAACRDRSRRHRTHL